MTTPTFKGALQNTGRFLKIFFSTFGQYGIIAAILLGSVWGIMWVTNWIQIRTMYDTGFVMTIFIVLAIASLAAALNEYNQD